MRFNPRRSKLISEFFKQSKANLARPQKSQAEKDKITREACGVLDNDVINVDIWDPEAEDSDF